VWSSGPDASRLLSILLPIVGDEDLVVHAPLQALFRHDGFHEARQFGRAVPAEGVEHANLDVRVGTEHGELEILARDVPVVEEQVHPHAAVRRGEEPLHEHEPRGVVVKHEILEVEAAVRRLDEIVAGRERVHAGRHEEKGGLAFVALQLGLEPFPQARLVRRGNGEGGRLPVVERYGGAAARV